MLLCFQFTLPFIIVTSSEAAAGHHLMCRRQRSLLQ